MERWASPFLAAQASYLRHLGAAPTAEVVEREGVYAVRTGIASNTENGVIARGDVPVPADVVAEVIVWFKSARLPASWLCAEGECRENTTRALEAAACRPDRGAWEMRAAVRQLDLTDYGIPADVRIAPVDSERELDAWLDVAGGCGWFDTSAERRAWKKLHLGLRAGNATATRLYVAFRGDRAVGMASAFFSADILLLTAVGVLDQERRHGIGRSLAVARLREAQARGCRLAVLAPSADGRKLYDAIGFEAHPQPVDRWFYLPTPTPD